MLKVSRCSRRIRVPELSLDRIDRYVLPCEFRVSEHRLRTGGLHQMHYAFSPATSVSGPLLWVRPLRPLGKRKAEVAVCYDGHGADREDRCACLTLPPPQGPPLPFTCKSRAGYARSSQRMATKETKDLICTHAESPFFWRLSSQA